MKNSTKIQNIINIGYHYKNNNILVKGYCSKYRLQIIDNILYYQKNIKNIWTTQSYDFIENILIQNNNILINGVIV